MKPKAQIRDAQCIECQEGITNPICPECLAKEMESWNSDMKSILIRPEDSDLDMNTDNYTADGVNCVFCGRPMSICAHCYCRDVYKFLAEKKPEMSDATIHHNSRMLIEFLTQKNPDVENLEDYNNFIIEKGIKGRNLNVYPAWTQVPRRGFHGTPRTLP